eukprot:15198753-Heterocapsa_arctica.AAC.1
MTGITSAMRIRKCSIAEHASSEHTDGEHEQRMEVNSLPKNVGATPAGCLDSPGTRQRMESTARNCF